MTTILAVEAAATACSVALSLDGKIHQLIDTSPRQHARKLLPMVDRLLGGSSLSVGDLDAIAYTCGPGSFTGLRIGFGIVQGLAFGAGLPVVGVSTLEAMAAKAVTEFQAPPGFIVPALDARMGELYMGVYEVGAAGQLSCTVADCAVAIDGAGDVFPSTIHLAVGDGWRLIPACSNRASRVEVDFSADAAVVAGLAARYYSQGRYQSVDDAELAYIRNEISWQKRVRVRDR